MKLFIDSADPKEITALAATGLVDGVTTNPSLAAKTGQNLFDALKAICDLGLSSVSAEVSSPWFFFQIGVVLTGAGVAYAIGATIRARVDTSKLGYLAVLGVASPVP